MLVRQKNELINSIKNMDQSGIDLIYVLIRTYAETHKKDCRIPYKGSENSGTISYDINDLPSKLGQMLFKFTRLHTKKVETDSKRPESL